MMRLLLLIPSLALADVKLMDEGVDAGIVTTLNCVGSGITCTRSGSTGNITVTTGGTVMTGNLDLYVSTTGNDSNACIAGGTSACLTVQGALNKIPKNLLYRAIVHVGSGSFGTFAVSGFTTDIGLQRTTAGLMIDGTLANSTGLATGTATGTTTGATAGTANTQTYGTLTDSTQSWTTDNLQGRFVNITAGTGVGQIKVICNNTATAITVCGSWTAPTAGATYAIQDSTTDINTCAANPPSAGGTTLSTLTSAIRVQNNAAGSSITFRNLSVSAACSFGIASADISGLIVNRVQFTTTSGTASRISHGGPMVVDTISSTSTSTTTVPTHVTLSPSAGASNASVVGGVSGVGGPRGASATVQNSFFAGGGTGVSGSNASVTLIQNQYANITARGILIGPGTGNCLGQKIDCTAAAGAVAITVGDPGSTGGGSSRISSTGITDCEIGFRVIGQTGWISAIDSMTASGITTGYDISKGGLITFVTGTAEFAVSGNQVSLDSGAVTGTYASIPASGNCITSLNYGSRFCRE